MSEVILDEINRSPVISTRPSALKEQFRILYAIMLHDIKSRYFGNGLGFLVTIVWPLAHILIILGINAGQRRCQSAAQI